MLIFINTTNLENLSVKELQPLKNPSKFSSFSFNLKSSLNNNFNSQLWVLFIINISVFLVSFLTLSVLKKFKKHDFWDSKNSFKHQKLENCKCKVCQPGYHKKAYWILFYKKSCKGNVYYHRFRDIAVRRKVGT